MTLEGIGGEGTSLQASAVALRPAADVARLRTGSTPTLQRFRSMLEAGLRRLRSGFPGL